MKDKKIYLSELKGTYGKGNSQNDCVENEYRLDLSSEDWYVFNDNYGTSEEKYFLKYFKSYIEPKLKAKGLEYYVIRNERVPEFAIYSFEAGERFEPDFLLFVKRKNITGDSNIYQAYIEPKGNKLLEEDFWKNRFLGKILDNHKTQTLLVDNHKTQTLLVDNYKILGLPFFNKENRMEEFETFVDKWLEMV